MLFRALVVLALTTFSTPGAETPPNQNPHVSQDKRAGADNNDADQIHNRSGNAAPSLPKENRPAEQANRDAAQANAESKQADYYEGGASGLWMVLLTGGLVVVGGGQALILWRQTRIIHESLRIARGSLDQLHEYVSLTADLAESSKKSAEAATVNANAAAASNALTRESNEITKEATELTRQSIVLAHRPRLLVKNIIVRVPEGRKDRHTERLAETLADSGGEMYVVNIGRTKAKMTQMHSEVLIGAQLPMVPPYDGKAGAAVDISIPPGGHRWFRFPSERYRHERGVNQINQYGEHLWVLGWLEYTDDLGNPRRTAFCRDWSTTTERFSPVKDDPDYEYAD